MSKKQEQKESAKGHASQKTGLTKPPESVDSPSPDTRRNFLRVSGAGMVGFTLNSGSSARAADGDPTTLQITSVAPRCWVYDGQNLTLVSSTNLPYPPPEQGETVGTLDEGDVINCYDSAGNLVTQSLTVDSTAGDPSNHDVTYSNSGDSVLEVDLSVLESFEENYDPAAGGGGSNTEPPYTIEDSTGPIGING